MAAFPGELGQEVPRDWRTWILLLLPLRARREHASENPRMVVMARPVHPKAPTRAGGYLRSALVGLGLTMLLAVIGLMLLFVADYGSVVSVRLQRATLQLWKSDTPWASAGSVVVGNGGDLAKEAGLWPVDAMTPISVVAPPGG